MTATLLREGSAGKMEESTAPQWGGAHLLGANPRPRCQSCNVVGPTIDGFCVNHMTQATEIAFCTVSAEDALAFELTTQ